MNIGTITATATPNEWRFTAEPCPEAHALVRWLAGAGVRVEVLAPGEYKLTVPPLPRDPEVQP